MGDIYNVPPSNNSFNGANNSGSFSGFDGANNSNSFSVGNGNSFTDRGNGSWSTLTLADDQNQVSLANVMNTAVIAYGDSKLVFLSGVGDAIVDDKGTNLFLDVCHQAGTLILEDFQSDAGSKLHLTDPAYTSTAQALSALMPDGAGGVVLPLSAGGRIDFVGASAQELVGHINVGNP